MSRRSLPVLFMATHQLLLRELNSRWLDGPPEFSESILKFPDSSSRFRPPIEQLVKSPISLSFVMKALWGDYNPPFLFKNPTQAYWAPISCSAYRSRAQVFAIDKDNLQKVLTACYVRKTTLAALLNALVLTSLPSHLEESKARAFACSTAIDQRRFLPSNHSDYPWMEPNKTIWKLCLTPVPRVRYRACLPDSFRSRLE